MRCLLKIRTSIFGDEGISSRLLEEFCTEWQKVYPHGRIATRDIGRNPIPYLDAGTFHAFNNAETTHRGVALSERLIAELEGANDIAIGVPMYNFNIPATLRTYFDYVVRAGRTFRYTQNGAEGLLTGRRAFVFISRGGRYETATDMHSQHLHQILRFIGIEDRRFVYAEGMALDELTRSRELAIAQSRAKALLQTGILDEPHGRAT